MLTVHLRVNDAATGEPTPCRICITDAQGQSYAPLGHSLRIPTARGEDVGVGWVDGRLRWFTIDGSTEIRLPSGVPLRCRIRKGLFHTPIDETIQLKPGQLSKRFELSCRWDPRSSGWCSVDGDARFLSPHRAALEADAEDLDYVQLAAGDFPTAMLDGQTYPTTPLLEAFTGPEAEFLRGRRAGVAVGTLNQHAVLGKLALWASHRVVFPLTYGPPDHSDDGSHLDWCYQCRRKGGVPVWVDPFESSAGVPGGLALVAALLGQIRLVAFTGFSKHPALLALVYRLWNAGLPLRLVGTSRKADNKTPLGAMRTFVGRPAGQDRHDWRAVAAALETEPSLVTNGPWLTLTKTGSRQFTAEVRSLVPWSRLDIFADGLPVASATPSEAMPLEPQTLVTEITGPTRWVAARVVGPQSVITTGQPLFAQTSPWLLDADLPPQWQPADVGYIRQAIERTADWIRHVGRFEQLTSQAALLADCEAALSTLR